MQTHIYFNVAKNGLHLFKTDWYYIRSEINLIRDELVKAFPRKEGYTIQQYSRDESMELVYVDN